MANSPAPPTPPTGTDPPAATAGENGDAANRRRLLMAGFVGTVCFAVIQYGLLPGAAHYLPQLGMIAAVIVVIAIGADVLVDASTRVALSLGISELVVGLTIVAFGTSSPEIAASLVAGLQGNGDICIANVVGSNIFNLCFILGGVAMLVKGGLKVDRVLVLRDGSVLLAGTLLIFLFVGATSTSATRPAITGVRPFLSPLNLTLDFGEGLVLLGALGAYMYVLYRSMRSQRARRHKEVAAAGPALSESDIGVPGAGREPQASLWQEVPALALGLVLVVGGCHLLVGWADLASDGSVVGGLGALWFAKMWNVPHYVVGVTIVAAGTSAPEFVVSLVAASRGAFGISVGNLLGSDIFNMFAVVGIAGVTLQPPLAPPVSVSAAVVPSLLMLTALVMLTLVFMWTGRRVTRTEGIILALVGVGRWVMDFSAMG